MGGRGWLINIDDFNTTLKSYVLSYRGNVTNCVTESSFNSTIIGSCGKDVSVRLTSNVIIGVFSGIVHCSLT